MFYKIIVNFVKLKVKIHRNFERKTMCSKLKFRISSEHAPRVNVERRERIVEEGQRYDKNIEINAIFSVPQMKHVNKRQKIEKER